MNKIKIAELREDAIKRQQVIEVLMGVGALCVLFGLVVVNYIMFYL